MKPVDYLNAKSLQDNILHRSQCLYFKIRMPYILNGKKEIEGNSFWYKAAQFRSSEQVRAQAVGRDVRPFLCSAH